MYYKAPNGSIHFLEDAAYEHLLPPGSVPVEESIALTALPKPPVTAQIATLEAQGTSLRKMRELILATYEKDGDLEHPAYVQLKALDQEIGELRAKL